VPIYEYKCRKCNKKFELLRSMSASDEDIECPECGAESPERVFSMFGTGSSGVNCAPGVSSGST